MSVCGEWFCVEVVEFRGHENVRATHRTTIELTREPEVTPRGDCIIGVRASKGLAGFRDGFKSLVRRPGARVVALITDSLGHADVVSGFGDPGLSYRDPDRIIIRRSGYIAPNTAMVRACKSAKDLSRDLINSLKEGVRGVAIFVVMVPAQAERGFEEIAEGLAQISRLQELSTHPRCP